MKSNRIACLAILAILAPVAYWQMQDRSVWLWDQSWYGEVSVDLWFTSHTSLRQWGANMLHEMNLKPPGIVWIGQFFVPLRAIFGSIESALLMSVLIAQALVLWLIFKIGEAMKPSSRWAPLAGVFFAAATQSFVGLSHQFMVEPLQALAVAWMALVAAKSDEWPAARILIHLAAATLLGLLAKLTTPVYCALFYPYIGWKAMNKWRAFGKISWKEECDRASSRLLVVLFAVILPVTAAWYALNARSVWQHARDSASGEIALSYGFRASLIQKLLVWSGLLYQSFLAPYLAWMLALALLLGIAGFALRGRAALLSLSVGQIALLLIAVSAADAVESRYLYALVVYLAICASILCAPIQRTPWVFLLLTVCVGQWAVVNGAALGAFHTLRDLSPLLVTAHPDTAEYDELTRMVEVTSNATGRYNVVGVEEPWLNANGASFFAAKHRLATGVRSFYTSLGYAEKDVSVALKRLDDLNTHYFITLDELHQNALHQSAAPDFLNVVSLSVLQAVRQDPRFHPIDFPSTLGVLIFERQ